MNSVLRLIPAALALACLAMAKQPDVSVRFFAEANQRDGEPFSKPVTMHFPERQAYIEKIPSISERSIKAMYPFQATDGTWGASFLLDNKGRIDLEVVSTERRGSSMVVFVVTKKGVHQVIDMIIDKPVRDGIISIPRGLTELEIAALTKVYPIIGKGKKQQEL